MFHSREENELNGIIEDTYNFIYNFHKIKERFKYKIKYLMCPDGGIGRRVRL